ncbi:putative PDDEXK endonuclease [Thiorhodococcus minor]|uniref:Holliday junction resolvase n=1 Tax=Thiorhodococcus minor TaxID=57489 RepID=A0A6M0K4C5_9GAMM|nr:hypothetical protein [Thiorhodococcus minor]NEV64134.1 hypothetical protein [Thiorhodococcus minor]
MSRSQRTKGSAGEREACRALHDLLGVRLVRNLEQSRRGGHDLIVHPDEHGPVADALRGFAPEIKRHARATAGLLAEWWRQAVEQADQAGLVPVLIFREDRGSWRARLPLATLRPDLPKIWTGLDFTAELSLPGFAAVVRETEAVIQQNALVEPDSVEP